MAAARMGLKTALYTLNLDLIAQMSCNPAVGGIAKGHLVREVDALGGIMGEVTDAVGIQFRLLNTSRGPAVWSPRAQCDKQQYRLKMRELLESEPNLHIKQAEVAELIVEQLAISNKPILLSSRAQSRDLLFEPQILRLGLKSSLRMTILADRTLAKSEKRKAKSEESAPSEVYACAMAAPFPRKPSSSPPEHF